MPDMRESLIPCRYSNIVCSGYPLGALDSIQSDGSTNWSAQQIQQTAVALSNCSLRLSAMYLILNGPKEEHLNMLEGGIIAKLLEEKWKTFARVRRSRGGWQKLDTIGIRPSPC